MQIVNERGPLAWPLCLMVAGLWSAPSCYGGNMTLTDLRASVAPATYDDDVQIIFNNRCADHHNEDDDESEAGIYLDSYEGATSLYASGSNEGTPIAWTVIRAVCDDFMPPSGEERVTDFEKEILVDWVNRGMAQKANSAPSGLIPDPPLVCKP